MSFKDKILKKLAKLTEAKQSKVMDFIDFLSNANTDVKIPDENKDWSLFSLKNALKGMENEEDLYSINDIKIKYE